MRVHVRLCADLRVRNSQRFRVALVVSEPGIDSVADCFRHRVKRPKLFEDTRGERNPVVESVRLLERVRVGEEHLLSRKRNAECPAVCLDERFLVRLWIVNLQPIRLLERDLTGVPVSECVNDE